MAAQLPPPGTFKASGTSHQKGLVPDPGAVAGTTRYLREDATWSIVVGVSGGVDTVFGRFGSVVAQTGDYTVAQVTGAAPLASPAFTGTPTAPTAAPGTNTAQIATTAFVLANAGSGAVSSVFGRTGAVVAASGDYTAAQVTNAVSTASTYSDPSWLTGLAGSKVSGNISGNAANVTGTVAIGNGGTGQVTAGAAFDALSPLTTLGDVVYRGTSSNVRLAGNTTATRQFLRQVGTGSVSAAPAWDTLQAGDIPSIAESQVTGLVSDLAAKAPLASPAFTGTPTAPTPATVDNSTKIATTAWVNAQGFGGSGAVSSVFTRTGNVVAQAGDYTAAQVTNAVDSTSSYANPAWITSLVGSKISGDIAGNAASITGSIAESQVTSLVSDLSAKAPLASPMFTGTPAAPTPSTGDNSTKIATTAFVRSLQAEYNVLAYGLVGDGTTDNTSALQALITLAASAGGGTILFPAGTYAFASTVDLTNKDAIVFRGVGPNRNANPSHLVYTPASGSLFHGGPAFGIQFEGLYLSASSGSYSGSLVAFDSSGADVAAIHVDNCAFVAPTSAHCLILIDKANTCSVRRSAFQGGDWAIRLGEVSYAIAITVADRCIFTGQGTGSIRCDHVEDIVISGNVFEPTTAGKRATLAFTATTINYGCEVHGNWFGDDSVAGTDPWIDLNTVLGATIIGNRIAATTGATAIQVNQCTGVLIAGNEIEGHPCVDVVAPGSSGIRVDSNYLGGTNYGGTLANDWQNYFQGIGAITLRATKQTGQSIDLFEIYDDSANLLYHVDASGYFYFNGTMISYNGLLLRGGSGVNYGDFAVAVGGSNREFRLTNNGTSDYILTCQGGSDVENASNGCVGIGVLNPGGSRLQVTGRRAAESVLNLVGASGQTAPLLDAGTQLLASGAVRPVTLADSAAPNSSLYFGSDHLDGASYPQLCRKDGAGTVTVLGTGTVKKYTALIGDGSSTAITITQATHGLAADRTNLASVRDATSDVQIQVSTTYASNGDVTFSFTTAPTTNQYRVVIIG